MTRKTLTYGSYIRNDLTGLGADDASQLSLPDMAMMQLLATTQVPSQTATEWAEQTGDVSWQQVTALVNYQIFPITDQTIVSVATVATFAPTTIAVLAPFLSFGTAVSKAFEGTPYAYSLTEAVYSQLDTNEPPRIVFLYWLTLRPQADPKRGNTSLVFAATQIGGVLTYVHEIPLSNSDRPAPKMSFQQALAQQSGQLEQPVPGMPATTNPPPQSAPIPALQPGQPVTPSPVQASAASSSKTLVLVGVGAAAAFVGYQYFKGKQR